MTPKPVILLIFLLASSKAWDFDLLVETIYDHFESYDDDNSAESENSPKPASSTSSVSSSPAPSTTAGPPSSSALSTAATPPSSSPSSTSATSPVVLAAPVSTASPSTRRKRELLYNKDDNQFKRLYENVPYPSRYAPDYQEPLRESANSKENHREARKRAVKAKNDDSTKVELIKLLLRLVEDSENEEPKHNRPNVVQRIRIEIPQVHHEVIDHSNQTDKERCKADDKNYITCVTDRKMVETIKINPVDHSEVRKIHENIKVSIMKNDKLPPDTNEESIDKVFKHEPYNVGPMNHEEDDYYPYHYHHRNDYNAEKNRRKHRPDYLSSRFNPEDEKKDGGKEAPSTSTTQK